jgi:NADPH:quinone reductase-like Zn-dependent oxidoreductase
MMIRCVSWTVRDWVPLNICGLWRSTSLVWTDTGRIHPIIGHTFPLEHATAAHTAIEARDVIGKTLLLVAAS